MKSTFFTQSFKQLFMVAFLFVVTIVNGQWKVETSGASKVHRVFKNPKAVYQVITVNRAQGATTIQVTPETALITGYIL
jgi:hypothetical protein